MDQSLESLAEKLHKELDIKDRTYHLKTYKSCFVGSELVEYLLANDLAATEKDAVDIGNLLFEQGVFLHVTKDHNFKNEYLFYRFSVDEENHGKVKTDEKGAETSWRSFAESLFPTPESKLGELQSDIAAVQTRDASMTQQGLDEAIGVAPLDEFNVKLLDNVHPKEWEDPAGDDVYNLVVLGAGSGGLVSAAGAAGVGAKVALIESRLMGGDCLNVGCVPSKALIKAATVAHTVKHAGDYGVNIEGNISVDFGKVMQRLRRLRAEISYHDSAKRFSKDLDVDVFIGKGEFTSKNTIFVNGKTLTFKKAIIASGGSPAVPDIPGLANTPYLTNTNIFNLTALPKRLAVIGAGPIGLELAQAMARFGSEVTLLIRSTRILPKEDEDAAAVAFESFKKDGMNFLFKTQVKKVEYTAPAENDNFGLFKLQVEVDGTAQELEFDAFLIAAGRRPNVRGIGLEAAGAEYDEKEGVKVDDTLRTTNPNIFGVGDCCTRFQFTHVSDFMARLAIRNALFFGKGKFSSLLIPWATYTEPEIAHVGLNERDLETRKIPHRVFKKNFENIDRAILESETEGFVKIFTKKTSGEIIGATIVGKGAGDMISELSVAIQTGVDLATLSSVIHPYPTRAAGIREVGDLYNKTRLTPTVKSLLSGIVALSRKW